MKKICSFFTVALFSIFTLYAQQFEPVDEGAKKFEFKYKVNDSYRILSTVEEDVYVNSFLHHHAEILNRVSVKIPEVDEEKMTARHEGTFMTSESGNYSSELGSKPFSYGEEYKSVFTRDRFGVYTIEDIYFMPTVRDVPVFPDRELKPGDEWTYEGHEAHDLRRTFNLDKPYKVPFTAQYQYCGVVEQDGKKFDAFQVYYTMGFQLDVSKLPRNAGETPYKTTGFSSQLIFWDNEKGTIDHYIESFKIEILTTGGNTLTFTGNAHAEVTEFERTATTENVDAVTKQIEDLGIENVSVKKTDKGLTLSIENIQFKPDSDILLNSEKQKLDKLAAILENYSNNDLLVTGHTALRGTEESRQELSEKRADSVADYLIRIGVRDKYHIYTQGKGAHEPVATNSTEEGRSKNRRVEITIMD